MTTIECGAQATTDEHGCWTCTNGHAHHALGSPCHLIEEQTAATLDFRAVTDPNLAHELDYDPPNLWYR